MASPSDDRQSLRLLVTGVPCTGKTTFARWLAAEHGFAAFCADHDQGWLENMRGAVDSGWDVVLDYGIPAVSIAAVQQQLIRDLGLQTWWFDGDVDTAREIFVNRPGHPATLADWHRYMAGLVTHSEDYANLYQDRLIRTLEPGPQRLSNEEIWETIRQYK